VGAIGGSGEIPDEILAKFLMKVKRRMRLASLYLDVNCIVQQCGAFVKGIVQQCGVPVKWARGRGLK
jgi:hypothetical protein